MNKLTKEQAQEQFASIVGFLHRNMIEDQNVVSIERNNGIIETPFGMDYDGTFDLTLRFSEAPKPNTRKYYDCLAEKGTPAYASSQHYRDEIIEKAKRVVADIKVTDEIGTYYHVKDENDPEFPFYCGEDFVINKEKRTVVALLRGVESGDVHARGIAKCAPDDCFNVHIGKAIALRRALGLEVPSEYYNAPQPTEVRVGDVIRWIPSFSYVVDAVNGNRLDLTCVENKNVFFGHCFRNEDVTIVDDSRE